MRVSPNELNTRNLPPEQIFENKENIPRSQPRVLLGMNIRTKLTNKLQRSASENSVPLQNLQKLNDPQNFHVHLLPERSPQTDSGRKDESIQITPIDSFPSFLPPQQQKNPFTAFSQRTNSEILFSDKVSTPPMRRVSLGISASPRIRTNPFHRVRTCSANSLNNGVNRNPTPKFDVHSFIPNNNQMPPIPNQFRTSFQQEKLVTQFPEMPKIYPPENVEHKNIQIQQKCTTKINSEISFLTNNANISMGSPLHSTPIASKISPWESSLKPELNAK